MCLLYKKLILSGKTRWWSITQIFIQCLPNFAGTFLCLFISCYNKMNQPCKDPLLHCNFMVNLILRAKGTFHKIKRIVQMWLQAHNASLTWFFLFLNEFPIFKIIMFLIKNDQLPILSWSITTIFSLFVLLLIWHQGAQDGLKLIQPRITLNFWSTSLYLSNTETSDLHLHP